MRLIRNAQKEKDEKRRKAKRARDEFEKDCRKTGSGRNALAPPPELDPDECMHVI